MTPLWCLRVSDLAVHFSSGKDDWETPDDLFGTYDATYHFGLDAAANGGNHKCERWFGPGGMVDDAFGVPWTGFGNVWLNPPYSRGLQSKFVRKAAAEALTKLMCVVCLLPARTDTKLFHEVIKYGEVTFLKGRVKFKGAPSHAPFPSMIVVF